MDNEDRQVLSLDSQEHELKTIAEKAGITIVKTLKESRTAKEAGRPIFNDMISMIQSGKADAILCWKLDRLARNFLDGGLVIDMLQKSIIKEIRTYESTHLPNENVFIMAMQFGMANQYSRDLSVNVKRGNRAKLEKGGWPCQPPVGYKNDKATKTIVVDDERAKYVVRMFDLYSTGRYSFSDVADILYGEGLRTVSGKKVYRSTFHRIISNPFYCGLMLSNEKLYRGNHTPLISQETFDRAQEVVSGRLRPRPKSQFFPLRGFLTCESCGCMLTASLKKGHQYYYCTNGKGVCDAHKRYIRENTMYPIVASVLETIRFDEKVIDIMYKAAKEKATGDNSYAEAVLATLQGRLESLKTKESRLLDTFLAEQIEKDIYDAKILDIRNERVSLTRQIGETQANGKGVSTLEPIRNFFLEASRAAAEFLKKDDEEKHRIVSRILWNLSMKEKTVAHVSYKSIYYMMAKAPKTGDISLLCAC